MLRVQHFTACGEAVGVFHFRVHTSLEVIVGVLVGSFLRRTVIREVLNWPLSEWKPPDVVQVHDYGGAHDHEESAQGGVEVKNAEENGKCRC